MEKTWSDLADDLEKLMECETSPDMIRGKYAYLSQKEDDELYRIMCNLEHYFSDVDIRQKDIGYKEMQDNALRKLVGLLRSAKNLNEASNISFLV